MLYYQKELIMDKGLFYEQVSLALRERCKQMELSGSHADYVISYILSAVKKSRAKKPESMKQSLKRYLDEEYQYLELGSSHYDVVITVVFEIVDDLMGD